MHRDREQLDRRPEAEAGREDRRRAAAAMEPQEGREEEVSLPGGRQAPERRRDAEDPAAVEVVDQQEVGDDGPRPEGRQGAVPGSAGGPTKRGDRSDQEPAEGQRRIVGREDPPSTSTQVGQQAPGEAAARLGERPVHQAVAGEDDESRHGVMTVAEEEPRDRGRQAQAGRRDQQRGVVHHHVEGRQPPEAIDESKPRDRTFDPASRADGPHGPPPCGPQARPGARPSDGTLPRGPAAVVPRIDHKECATDTLRTSLLRG